MATFNERPGAQPGLARGQEGRWLGGVCIGLAAATGRRVGWIRLAFVVGALVGGLGIALYLACWLIVPVRGDTEDRPGATGVVILAQACGACLALLVLAALATVATVFGFGWVVVGAAAVLLVGVLAGRPRLGPAWTLLPIAALTLPALAVAAGGLRLTTQTGSATIAPESAQNLGRHVYRSGLNSMLVDLRRTPLPQTGTVALHIAAGVRRTIVALPSQRCVRVVVHYDVNPFAVRLGALLSGHLGVFSDAVVFGRLYSQSQGTAVPPAQEPGPTLDIHFSSQGGSLYVRDYPTAVDPTVWPDWPGFKVHLEPRPDVRGTPKKAAEGLLTHWRARLAAQEANARAINALLPGPCNPPPPVTPPPRRPASHRPARRVTKRPATRSTRASGRKG
ncbi:MAG TPA: PspC domain-containing protein [Solirubrobacteraceae bacterium]|nr:PspC domain-containing protein [Solirubrobacteraceae bacterium]